MFDSNVRAVVQELQEMPVPVTPAGVQAALGKSRRVRAWLDHLEATWLATITDRDVRKVGAGDRAELVRTATGCTAREAKARAVVAAQLGSMPAAEAALGSGEIGLDHAAALASVRDQVTREQRAVLDGAEADLVERATGQTPEQFRATLRRWVHDHTPDDGKQRIEDQRARSTLSISTADDGMTLIRGELDPESGAVVTNTLRRLVDEAWRSEDSRRQIDGSFQVRHGKRLANALVEACRRADAASVADGRVTRPTVIVTMTLDDLMNRLTAAGHSARLGDGTPISAAAARRLACDARLIPAVLGSRSEPLDVGRLRRRATGSQRAALRLVHDTCAAEGCDRPFDWCDIHHHDPWERGGSTRLDNLTPLCSRHHHLIHEGGWTVERLPNGAIRYLRPTRGDPPHPATPPQTGSPRPARPDTRVLATTG